MFCHVFGKYKIFYLVLIVNNNLCSSHVGFLWQEEEKKSGAERTRYTDFMDRLIEARDEEGKGLTLEEIRNEMDTFMFAGRWDDFPNFFWDSLISQFK